MKHYQSKKNQARQYRELIEILTATNEINFKQMNGTFGRELVIYDKDGKEIGSIIKWVLGLSWMACGDIQIYNTASPAQMYQFIKAKTAK